MAERKFKIRDLWPIGILLALVLGQIILFTPEYWRISLLVIGLAYGQNLSFTLAARARTRNNVLYHLCAVVLSAFVAFLTFRTILGPGSDFSLKLLLAYTAGTISGSLTGSYISMGIERLIGARMEEVSKEAVAKNEARNRRVALRVFPVLLIAGWSCQFLFWDNEALLPLLGIAGLVFFPDMAYAMRTWIQNRDNHYLTLGIGLVNGIVDFFRWTYLIKFDMRWGIFVPYATGGTGGSIAGSLTASRLTAWIDRKFGTTSSADAHIKNKGIKRPDFRPVWFLFSLAALSILVFPPKDLLSTVWFVLATVVMQISFSLISRARQRNNALYHLLAAICSNGSWFFVLHLVATMAKSDLRLFVPYAVGTAVGTLVGAWLAMQIELRVGALADSFVRTEPQKV